MSVRTWRWQMLDRRGEVHTYGTVDLWGDPDEQQRTAGRWAADKMALALWQVEPQWERLSGWRVRVWCDSSEVHADAEEWLAQLRGGPLARMRDRVELLTRPGAGR